MNLRNRLHRLLITLISVGIAFVAFGIPPALADCSTSNLTADFDQHLQKFMLAFNAKWPSTAQEKGLDPYEKVYQGSENLGCKYGGDEICGLQASKCEKEYVSLDLSDITGIQNMTMTSINATEAELVPTCPYATKGDNYSCVYSGVATANLSDANVAFNLGSAKAKAECKLEPFGPDFTETLYSGHGDCNVGSLDVTATLNVCMGGGDATGPAIISYVGLKDAKVKSTSDTKCHLSPSSPISLGDIKGVLLPGFSTAVEDVIDPVLELAIDDGFEELLPFSDN